ncbi:MAG: energy transducer TonB, partial [Acidobacteriota bacterium]
RIHGREQILPDEDVRREMIRKNVRKFHAVFRLCLDETGHPESILPMRSTGFADYDRELIGGMQDWVYSPFIVDGVPMPVCTEIQFVSSDD